MTDLQLSVHLIDAYNRRKQTLVALPSATSIANVQTFATAFCPLLDALTGMLIEDLSVQVPINKPGSGIKTTPTANISALIAGRFSFNAGVIDSYGVNVPGILPAFWSGLKDLAESGGTDLADFASAYWAGLSSINPTNGSGEDLLNLIRKSRGGHTK